MRRLTEGEQQRIRAIGPMFDPLQVKECVLSFPVEKREGVCLDLLSTMYEHTPQTGSNVMAVKTLLEDKFIAFTPSWEQLQSITTRPIRDCEIFKYLATTNTLSTGFPLRGKDQGGAVAQMCTEKNEQLLLFALGGNVTSPLATQERLQLVANVLRNPLTWWTRDHNYDDEDTYYHPSWQDNLHIQQALRVIEVITNIPFALSASDIVEQVFAPNPYSHRFNPFGLIHLSGQEGVGMASIVDKLIERPETGKRDAQVCLEQMFLCGRYDVVNFVLQHKQKDILNEHDCPTLFKYVQRETLRLEVNDKGAPKQKLKM